MIGDSVGKVEAGSKLVNQAGTTMGEIVDSVRRVTDIMSEITAASREQEVGIQQINLAITEMDTVTQRNAALVEEAAAAAESLQDQAGGLAQVVGVFKLGGADAMRSATNPVARPAPAKRLAQSSAAAAGPKSVPDRGVPVAARAPARAAQTAPEGDAGGNWEAF